LIAVLDAICGRKKWPLKQGMFATRKSLLEKCLLLEKWSNPTGRLPKY
jgi:hypothetical protein